MVTTSHNMTFTQEQKKEAYKKLSQETQNFIMDSETTELIENYLKETGLTQEQSVLADSEILYALYGLQTLTEAMSNIAQLSGKNIHSLSKLKTDLDENIFSKIKSDQNSEKISDIKLNKTTENIVGEISKKYSLNETQTLGLMNIIASNNEQVKESDIFLETIISELDISRLLAEQVGGDLKNRLFEKVIPIQITTLKPPLSRFETTKAVEIRPESLPAVEDPSKIGVPRYIPTNTYKPVSEISNNPPVKTYTVSAPTPTTPSTATYRPKSTVQETVQQVTPVPRFTVNTDASVQNKPVAPQSTAENKLNNITTNTPEKNASETIEPKYNIDPYREPLQ